MALAGATALGILASLFYLALRLGGRALHLLGASVDAGAADGLQAFTVRAAAIGLLVMALIQVARSIYPIRGVFHERHVGRWLNDGRDFNTLRQSEVERLAKEICSGWGAPENAEFRIRLSNLRARMKRIAENRGLSAEIVDGFVTAWCDQAARFFIEEGRNPQQTFRLAWLIVWPEAPIPRELRREWNEAQLDAWKWSRELRPELFEFSKAQDPLDQFVHLAAIRERRELFDLPLEQLCGQIGATAEQVVADPAGRMILLAALAGVDEAIAYQRILERKSVGTEGATNEPVVDVEFSARRNRIGLIIQRNIDALQVSVGIRWRRSLKIAALVISAMLSYGLIWNSSDGTQPRVSPTQEATSAASPRSGEMIHQTRPPMEKLFEIAMTMIAAGYLATVSRDLIAVIERHRG